MRLTYLLYPSTLHRPEIKVIRLVQLPNGKPARKFLTSSSRRTDSESVCRVFHIPVPNKMADCQFYQF